MTRAEAEAALDAGRLYARVLTRTRVGGRIKERYIRCRRNGETKLWVTRPSDFRIPVKFGFRAVGAITPATIRDFIERRD